MTTMFSCAVGRPAGRGDMICAGLRGGGNLCVPVTTLFSGGVGRPAAAGVIGCVIGVPPLSLHVGART